MRVMMPLTRKLARRGKADCALATTAAERRDPVALASGRGFATPAAPGRRRTPLATGRRFAALAAAVLALLLAGVGLAGCASSGEDGYQNALYIYMCGSTLETKSSVASQNIESMLGASIPDSTAVVIETGGARKWRSHDIPSDELVRYKVRGGKLVELERLDDASMGDSQTLASFLQFCQQSYPADNTTLLLWNHGAGSTRGVCLDENHGLDGLSAGELDEALDAANARFDNVCFDACLMAGYETMRVVANHASTMIASEEIEPALGWDYKTLVESLGSSDFAGDVLSSYQALCEKNGKRLYTLSAVDLGKFTQVEADFDIFCNNVLGAKADSGQLQDVSQAAIDAMGFGEKNAKSDFVDLSQFAENLGFALLPQAIANCTQSVNGADREGASGISIFFPLSGQSTLREYLASETSDAYSLFLGSNFASTGGSSIAFTDEGSVSGTDLAFAISDSTAANVQSVAYDIYQLHESEPATCLGFDNDIDKDGKGSYTISFSGNWVALDGHLLCCEPIDSAGSTTVFAAPVKLNGAEGNLRFTYNRKDKTFAMQGFVELEEDGTQGRLENLESGDQITILAEQFESGDSLDTQFSETATIVVSDSMKLTTATLPDGYYQIYGIVTDLYGNERLTSDFIIRLEDGAVADAQVE